MILHHEVRGNGPPLILLHGLAGSNRWWAHNMEEFSHHFRVYALDLPGYGGMRRHAREFAVETAANWLLRAVDHLEPGRRVSLMGHSTGGLICAMLAAMEPGRVDRMVLAAPAIELRNRTIAANLIPLAHACLTSAPSFWPILLADSARAGPALLYRTAKQLFAIDGMRFLPAIETPSLLVWGEHDRLVPPSCAPALQSALVGSRVHIIPHAGHVVMWDAPAEFNRVALDFLLP